MPRYDLQVLGYAANKVVSLRDEVEQSRSLLGSDTLSGSPFGALAAGDRAYAAIRDFQDRMRAEFGDAVTCLDATAEWLRSVATGTEQTDEANAENVRHAIPSNPLSPGGVR